MKKLVALLILFSLSVGGGSAWFALREETASFAPRWEVGQTWKVQVISGQDHDNGPGLEYRLWNFEVTEKTRIGDETFYTVKISAEGKEPLRFVLEFIYPDLSLISVATYENGSLVREERASSSTFFFNDQGARIIPLDFLTLPTFNLSNRQRNKSVGFEREEVIDEGPSPIKLRYEFDQHILSTRAVKTLKITAADSQRKIVGYQFWEEGRPWWTNAKRNIDGQLVSEGILIDDPAP